MGLKKKLGLGVSTAALGLSLIGGGTFAYFSDTAEADGTFSTGTLDLSADPTTVIDVENLKPGDWMNRSFELINGGTLDISEVLLSTDYSVDGNDEFGEHIMVKFLYNDDKTIVPIGDNNIIYNTTLEELKNMEPDAVENKIFVPYFEERGGLEAGDSDELHVQFEFVDNDEDQNEFQDTSLNLEWTFEARQGEGEEK
ncbi:TasA family protein [Salibacterium aidingense]|uniref:TasA family protein n=1 Tax=Salibacterium aidingense TaxID=384933 RepID=UPI000426F66E|nr:TasA family protein [Salibacterium aidingense]